MDAQQKRLFTALAIMAVAILVYDLPALLPCDRVVSNTVAGNLQTVVVDLTKTDPWAIHAWVRQLCYALLCSSMAVASWTQVAARCIGVTGAFWYLAQAADAYFTGNIFDDGKWEYGLLTMAVLLCGLMIHYTGWKRHDA